MNNILYLILHSPSNTVLAKGTIIKQDNKKIFIDYNGKQYVYIKDEKDVRKMLCNSNMINLF